MFRLIFAEETTIVGVGLGAGLGGAFALRPTSVRGAMRLCEDETCAASPGPYAIGMKHLRTIHLISFAATFAFGVAAISADVAAERGPVGLNLPRGSAMGGQNAVAGAADRRVGFNGQARPHSFDPELLRNGDLIRYRELSRDDFLAAGPPAEAASAHGQLGAATCVFLTTGPETQIRASAREPDLPPGQVRARVENLRFFAYLDRDCSWWNPSATSLPDEYMLQHEQIHFALFEIAARRLNRRAEELTEWMEVTTGDQQSAMQEVRRRIDAQMQRAMDEILARSNDFDRETSRTYRRDRQDWWWRSVNVELERFAAPGGGR